MRGLKYILFCLFLASGVCQATEATGARRSFFRDGRSSVSFDGDSLSARYGHLSPKQLIDTANYHYNKNEFDTALICYNMVINIPETDDGDAQLHKLKVDALNNSAVIYYNLADYVKAYQLLVDALELCEKWPDNETEVKARANLGNVYYRLGEYETAGQYYSEALELSTDSIIIMRLQNNIGAAELEMGRLDRAFSYLERALQISRRHNNTHMYSISNTLASIYRKKGEADSAFRYYFLSLEAARNGHKAEYEAETLSDLGSLFFETGKTKDAEKYISLASDIAKENNINTILLKIHLLQSEMERSRGNYKKALGQLEEYNKLHDSLFSADKLMDINQLQRINEISKTNRQIENLTVEQHIKERTIGYQKLVLFIAFGAVVLLAAILAFVFRQNKKLNRAYRALFEKNVENLELRDRTPHEHLANAPYHDNDGKLLARILSVMEDTAVICDPEFSIIKLALLVESNNTYVSQVINNTMHKNFRALLNEYRIREAQRLLQRSDAAKYTIESISLQLGYKSPNTFRAAFAEITGVSPGFYLKSLRENV